MPDELAWLARVLEQTGIRYAFTGSVAGSVWGVPRTTVDADVLAQLRESEVDRLVRGFAPPDWYLDRDAIRQALETAGEFNAIHGASGTKVDFWVAAPGSVGALRLMRRVRENLAGVESWVLAAEDVVLAKLEWMRDAQSERQRDDVLGILRARKGLLDAGYLLDSATRLGVRGELDELVKRI